MTFSKTTSHLQDMFTQTVQHYLATGYTFLLSDSGTNYLTHVDLQRDDRFLRILMRRKHTYVDSIKLNHFVGNFGPDIKERETIELCIQDLLTREITPIQTVYVCKTQPSKEIVYTDLQSEYEVQVLKHFTRLESRTLASSQMFHDQKTLKSIVKGKSGFGKKNLKSAQLFAVRYPRAYEIFNMKTFDSYTVHM